jgi:hypothetical protein
VAARGELSQALANTKVSSWFFVNEPSRTSSIKRREKPQMIDPKLDRLPVEGTGGFESASEKELTEEQRTQRARRGLSINDTIAAGPNMSVGARGLDYSGVEGGAGAAAGMSQLTPGERGESPAPNIVPGARGTGNAPRGDWNVPDESLSNPDLGPTNDEISARAYQCWHERGCPHGSPEEDWHRAEEQLRKERSETRRAMTAGAGGI